MRATPLGGRLSALFWYVRWVTTGITTIAFDRQG
jgi:hypothetical protein